MPPNDWPLKLPYGGTLANQAALDQYLAVQRLRSKHPGYLGRISRWHVNELEKLLKQIEK